MYFTTKPGLLESSHDELLAMTCIYEPCLLEACTDGNEFSTTLGSLKASRNWPMSRNKKARCTLMLLKLELQMKAARTKGTQLCVRLDV